MRRAAAGQRRTGRPLLRLGASGRRRGRPPAAARSRRGGERSEPPLMIVKKVITGRRVVRGGGEGGSPLRHRIAVARWVQTSIERAAVGRAIGVCPTVSPRGVGGGSTVTWG